MSKVDVFKKQNCQLSLPVSDRQLAIFEANEKKNVCIMFLSLKIEVPKDQAFIY